MHVDVLDAFLLFLACTVDVAVSGVFVYAVVFKHVGSKVVQRGPWRPKHVLGICWGVVKTAGGSEVVFLLIPKGVKCIVGI